MVEINFKCENCDFSFKDKNLIGNVRIGNPSSDSKRIALDLKTPVVISKAFMFYSFILGSYLSSHILTWQRYAIS